MKAAGRLVLMYLMLAVCLGMVSLYVGCVEHRRTPEPAKPPVLTKKEIPIEKPVTPAPTPEIKRQELGVPARRMSTI